MKSKIDDSRAEVVVLFAGDSGDGIQFTGSQFTETVEQFGNDISTFPNFPADIRAPSGSISGVSGFQLKMGSREVFTPGDQCDVLVVMNAAALKVNLPNLKKGGIIIANTSGFDRKNLRHAKYIDEENPLTDHSLDTYELHSIDITTLTREALKDSGLALRDIDRCKNMFVLGFIYWMFSQQVGTTINFIEQKFKKNPQLKDANIKALKTGYHYGDTSETFTTRFKVKSAKLPPGQYRNINGNQAVALGLVAAANRSDMELFFASYPITPASEILHDLSRYKQMAAVTYQAEDEIAAACASIGAAYGGSLAATASSGPGIALKGEALGLAVMLEIPFVCINVQRGGPSTGLPTKTEQADLFQALFGRNGEAPMVILAASSPRDCFDMTYEACRIAVEFMTPVMVLTDGYLANGAEPWKYPTATELPAIKPNREAQDAKDENGQYLPYYRNELGVRPWVVPGTSGYEHRIGGLEKEAVTGNVSYDPENHQIMTRIRAEKIKNIATSIPDQQIISGTADASLLVLGWGSTYGAIETAVRELMADGVPVAHAHLNYLYPFPANLGSLLEQFDLILIPEINLGQLAGLIKMEYGITCQPFNKMMGLPIQVQEIKEAVTNLLQEYEIS